MPSTPFPFLLSLLLLLPLTTLAWQIDFFSGPFCAAGDYTSSSHFGTGVPSNLWCLQPGQPTPDGGGDGNCAWFTDGGANIFDCTKPTRPWPMSFRIRKGSDCCVGVTDEGCDSISCYGQESVEKCFLIKDLERVGDDGEGELRILFQCYDHED